MLLRWSLDLFLLLCAVVFPGPRAARAATVDPAAKCRSTISRAAAAYLKAHAQALQKCRDAIVTKRLPAGTNCYDEPKVSAAIAKSRAKLSRAIAGACGGGDKTCGTGDDQPLASIGWNLGFCPSFWDGTFLVIPRPPPFGPIHRARISCRSVLSTCADVASCVACLTGTAVDRAANLAYGSLTPTDPKTDKLLQKCQRTLGKETLKFLAIESTALANCWDAVGKGKGTAPCPDPGDGKTAAAIAAAANKKAAAICKACGGLDKSCGGGDDETATVIGFIPSCIDVGGCARTVNTLSDVTTCLDCLTQRAENCADRGAVPSLAQYPSGCGVPTPNATPTPGAKLDYNADPVYGEANLSFGFSPDPYSVGMTIGGPVDISYLGGSCSGFATSAPSLRINFGGGGASLLRLYFVGSNGDPGMVINDPFGNFYCVKDSFGTVNPTIDFNNPAGGSYDVWITSLASNATLSGTMYVTENSGNHP